MKYPLIYLLLLGPTCFARATVLSPWPNEEAPVVELSASSLWKDLRKIPLEKAQATTIESNKLSRVIPMLGQFQGKTHLVFQKRLRRRLSPKHKMAKIISTEQMQRLLIAQNDIANIESQYIEYQLGSDQEPETLCFFIHVDQKLVTISLLHNGAQLNSVEYNKAELKSLTQLQVQVLNELLIPTLKSLTENSGPEFRDQIADFPLQLSAIEKAQIYSYEQVNMSAHTIKVKKQAALFAFTYYGPVKLEANPAVASFVIRLPLGPNKPLKLKKVIVGPISDIKVYLQAKDKPILDEHKELLLEQSKNELFAYLENGTGDVDQIVQTALDRLGVEHMQWSYISGVDGRVDSPELLARELSALLVGVRSLNIKREEYTPLIEGVFTQKNFAQPNNNYPEGLDIKEKSLALPTRLSTLTGNSRITLYSGTKNNQKITWFQLENAQAGEKR